MNDEGKIEELKKKLYSKTAELPTMKHVRMHDRRYDVERNWDEKEQQDQAGMQGNLSGDGYNKNKFYPFLKGLIVFAIIFLIVALGVAYYFFKVNPNTISNSNIDINVSGPVIVSAGQELSLDVNVFNNNSVALESADLVVTYPDGTRRADDKVTSLITDRVPIGDIQAGNTQRTTIKSILLGEAGSTKDINIALEYKVPGTSSLFVKEKSYSIGISTGAVSIAVDSVKEITPEQQTTFNVSVKSNSSDIIRDVVFKTDYPFGFDYVSAEPAPSSANNIWRLGDLAPGEIKTIAVNAKIFGQANQERTIRFSAGTAQMNNPNEIGTAFASFSKSINLTAPFLAADVSLNGIGDEIVITNSGTRIQGEILWKNNLDVPIHDVSLEGKINGVIIDRATVNPSNGFYKSGDDTMYWDKSTDKELEDLAPGQSGLSRFSINVFPLTKDLASNLRRPEGSLTFTIKGNRINENNVPEEVTSQTSRKIRVTTDLGMDSILTYNTGAFANTGPIPPRMDKETTYTINVKISNSFNSVKKGIYTAKLPIYVKWLGNVSPASASGTVTYSQENRTITWNTGDINPGTGYNTNSKEISFQVGFTPSLSQKGTSPVIVSNQRLAGTDSFTGAMVSVDGRNLDTKAIYDPKYSLDFGVVGK